MARAQRRVADAVAAAGWYAPAAVLGTETPTDLTDDQKAKIENAHATFLEQEHALLAKEKSDIDAVLTDDQKVEIRKMEDAAAAARKEKAAERKKEKADGDATTQPAQ